MNVYLRQAAMELEEVINNRSYRVSLPDGAQFDEARKVLIIFANHVNQLENKHIEKLKAAQKLEDEKVAEQNRTAEVKLD